MATGIQVSRWLRSLGLVGGGPPPTLLGTSGLAILGLGLCVRGLGLGGGWYVPRRGGTSPPTWHGIADDGRGAKSVPLDQDRATRAGYGLGLQVLGDSMTRDCGPHGMPLRTGPRSMNADPPMSLRREQDSCGSNPGMWAYVQQRETHWANSSPSTGPPHSSMHSSLHGVGGGRAWRVWGCQRVGGQGPRVPWYTRVS